jgi:hypothetical protein
MSIQDHRPRDEARELILEAVAQSSSGLSRSQIAKTIERAKTPHLIDLIEELVEEGQLSRRIKIYGNGVEGFIYSMSD